MAADFPHLYPYSRKEAKEHGELELWDESFRNNVACARAIEDAIRQDFDEETDSIRLGCAERVLEEYGFKRVNLVLAHSVKELSDTAYVSDSAIQWSRQTFVPYSGLYARYFVVNTASSLMEAFIRQARDAYQSLGLFGPEHCTGDRSEQDFTGKVLILSPDTLRESCWSQQNQLWFAHDGFGCGPNARGRSIRATCLGDGEMTRWNRSDFTGVLDEQYLPDWAREKLEELRGPTQEQNNGPTMDGMA